MERREKDELFVEITLQLGNIQKSIDNRLDTLASDMREITRAQGSLNCRTNQLRLSTIEGTLKVVGVALIGVVINMIYTVFTKGV